MKDLKESADGPEMLIRGHNQDNHFQPVPHLYVVVESDRSTIPPLRPDGNPLDWFEFGVELAKGGRA